RYRNVTGVQTCALPISWADFSQDTEWQKVVTESEAGGKLVTKVDSVFMTATDYSPGIKPSKAGEPRLFELRIYTASPGKLDDLRSEERRVGKERRAVGP